MTPEQAAALLEPFPKEQVGKLPKGGAMLDFVGHAAVTKRLLTVDPEWTWEPVAFDDRGLPAVSIEGNDAVLWIRLTVCGMTRLGVGIASAKSFELEKQLISDAIRNAAMRFGVALDLWSKEDLTGEGHAEAAEPRKPRELTVAKAKGLVLTLCGDDKDMASEAWNAVRVGPLTKDRLTKAVTEWLERPMDSGPDGPGADGGQLPVQSAAPEGGSGVNEVVARPDSPDGGAK